MSTSSPVNIKRGFEHFFGKEGFHGVKLDPPNASDFKKLWPHQKRFVKELRDEPYWFIVGPPAAGKTLTIAALLTLKLEADRGRRAIITVPQTIIGRGFEGNKFYLGNRKVFFDPGKRLHRPSKRTNSSQLKRFLLKPFTSPVEDRTIICTHQSLVAAYKRFPELFHDVLVVVDEAHHSRASGDEEFSNRLGRTVTGLVDAGQQVGLATATASRGDGGSLLGEYKDKFVVAECPFDDYLKVCYWFQGFSFDFVLYKEDLDLSDAVDKILGDKRKTPPKTIIHIPNVHSSSSGGKNRDVLAVYRGIAGGKDLQVRNPQGRGDGITEVKRGRRWVRVVNLVSKQNRDVKKDTIIAAHEDADSDRIDVIIALNMFKEGANWRWAESSIIIGHRGSFTEMTQMVGRGLRDAPEKHLTRVNYVLSLRDDVASSTGSVDADLLNNYLKALVFVLMLEDVFKPVEIRVRDKKTGKRRVVKTDLLTEAVNYDLTEKLRISTLVLEEMVKNNTDGHIMTVEDVAALLEQEGVQHDNVSLNDIALQITNSHNRQSRRINRLERDVKQFDVSGIDADLIQQSKHPLSYLLYYTKAIGIGTMKRLRAGLQGSFERKWWEHYHRLAEIIAPHGRVPTGNEELRWWMGHQRKLYRNDQLEDRFVRALERLPGWVWTPRSWQYGRDMLAESVAVQGRQPTVNETYKGWPVGKWASRQRSFYKASKLTDDRIRSLEHIPGWVWYIPTSWWSSRFESLKLSKMHYGRLPYYNETFLGVPVGKWLKSQHANLQQGSLSPDQIAKLEQLDSQIWLTSKERKWRHTAKEWEQFYIDTMRRPLAKSTDEKEATLGRWGSSQRVNRSNGKLSKERVEILNGIMGWVWDVYDKQWLESREEYLQHTLENYLKGEGYCLPPTDSKLYGWRKIQLDAYRRDQLSPERIASLEEIPGWYWNTPKGSPLRYTSVRKKLARSKTIITTYREELGHQRLPEDKQYWSMPAQCVNNNGHLGKLIPNTELHQLSSRKGLILPEQFHGVDHNAAVYEANRLYPGANWYHGDFYDTISYAMDNDPSFNPGVVNVDTVSEPRLGVELFCKVLYRLRDVRDVLFVGNFIRRNRGRWYNVTDLVNILHADPKFRQVADTLEWDDEKVFYTYYGATKEKRTVMTSVMMWRK